MFIYKRLLYLAMIIRNKKDPKVIAYNKKLEKQAKDKCKKLYGKTEHHDEKMITDDELASKLANAGGARHFIELVLEFHAPNPR